MEPACGFRGGGNGGVDEKRGVNTTVVRLSQVHDTRKQGLVPYIHAVAREKGVSAYIGDGNNRWPAAHVSDVALLYRLAFEKAEPGAIYHAVDEEGVSMRAIAEALARGLKVPVVSMAPEEAVTHFGWLAAFAGHDMPASSALTQQKLNWKPTGPGLIADLDRMGYAKPESNLTPHGLGLRSPGALLFQRHRNSFVYGTAAAPCDHSVGRLY